MIRKAKILVETYHRLRAILVTKLDAWAFQVPIARDPGATP